MKFSFNILRPIIFVLCGLGYLPLQSADQSSTREISSIKSSKEKELQKTSQEDLTKNKIDKKLN